MGVILKCEVDSRGASRPVCGGGARGARASAEGCGRRVKVAKRRHAARVKLVRGIGVPAPGRGRGAPPGSVAGDASTTSGRFKSRMAGSGEHLACQRRASGVGSSPRFADRTTLGTERPGTAVLTKRLHRARERLEIVVAITPRG